MSQGLLVAAAFLLAELMCPLVELARHFSGFLSRASHRRQGLGEQFQVHGGNKKRGWNGVPSALEIK